MLAARGQLARALRMQRIVGGFLGSSLIDLGYVDEESLGRTLADLLELNYASRDLLATVPVTVRRLLTRDVVRRYKAMPLKAVCGELHVALAGAGNLSHLDDLAFATGRNIVPWVSPEHCILQSIEQHYRIVRKRRFVPLSALRSAATRRADS